MNKSIYDILRCRYPENGYALMQEVSNAAGFGRSRSADFMVMSLWPSRGLSLDGIELKKYRGDWLKELKQPAKADSIFNYCDHWWLLTSGENVAKIDEIPEPWGWMEIRGDKVFVRKEAPALKPIPLDRSFLACLLRRAACKDGFVHTDSINDRIEAARRSAEESKDYRHKQLEERLTKLTNTVTHFKAVTGIDLLNAHNRYDTSVGKIGEAVNFLAKGGADSLHDRLVSMENTAKVILTAIENGIRSLPSVQGEIVK